MGRLIILQGAPPITLSRDDKPLSIALTMGRSRTKNKNLRSKAANAADNVVLNRGPSSSALLEKAQSLMVQCDYDLALRFVRRILDRDPKNVDAREMLGLALLETGEVETAKEVSASSNYL